MTDSIPPALTPEEWASGRDSNTLDFTEGSPLPNAGNLHVTYDSGYALVLVPESELPAMFALANAALPDDSPYKITREHVLALGEVVKHFDGVVEVESQDEDAPGEFVYWDQVYLRSPADTTRGLIAILTALLPPQ